MIEAERIEAGTKMVQNPDGNWEFVTNDDPRSDDARQYLAYSVVIIDGVHYPVNPMDPFRWIPEWCNWID